jgi:hypothetical protein
MARKHDGTLADALGATGRSFVVQVIGLRSREEAPYIAIREMGTGGYVFTVATIDNANAMRGLARAILRSLER